MTTPLQQNIERQRASLHNMLIDAMARIATNCARVWPDKDALDEVLIHDIRTLPYAAFMYALDLNGIQLSANARQDGKEEMDYQRDRSSRPYMANLSKTLMTLSDAYISLRVSRPSITALQPVYVENQHIGYIGADFDLRDLPLTRELYDEPGHWQQLKGDPAIRGTLFQQSRSNSVLDAHIDEVLSVLEELIVDNGVFHGKIHFSSSRATLWMVDDPYRYRLLDINALTDPDMVLAYPRRAYPEDAIIPADKIQPILATFKHLRFSDDTIYLRAGSLNIFNGIVALNFSCDGSHYIPYDQFLTEDSQFWEGML